MANSPFLANVRYRHYLREWRKARGLTQEELGQKIGMDDSAIGRFEKRQRGISLKIMYRLLDAFDILPGQFFAPPKTVDLNAMVRGASAEKRRRIVRLVQAVMEEAD